jgi:PucR C-terminal helix-turn-helix domain/GGDEF-like domain
MGATLRSLLAALGEPLVDVVAAPHGLDVGIAGVAIADPDDELDHYPDQLVLVIGARGREADRLVRGLARRGAAAVAVKDPGRTFAERRPDAEIAVLAVRADVRWDNLERLVRDVLETDGPAPDGVDPGTPDDLFALAQTVAVLTGGIVSIEDTASRVLAYSRTDTDTPDELRRLSILGRQGPPDYLRLLREWGVYERLRAGEDVVPVDEHGELGIRRRLAVGIHAGHRQLGTIWVQEGAGPFADRAEGVLVGAARVAAGHLVRRRARPTPARDLVAGLLEGRVGADVAGPAVGLDEASAAVVVGFAVRTDSGDAATHQLGRADLADVVPVLAATHRRGAQTAPVGARLYAVLPAVDRVEPALVALCADAAATVGRRTGARVQVGIGSAVRRLADVPASRVEADRVLDAMAPDADVALIGDLRAQVRLHETLEMLAAHPDLRDPAVARLVAYDAEHRTDLAGSVLAWLDALGDVGAASAALGVHPNTLRYRLRRAVDVGGLVLDEPRARLMHHLELLTAVQRRVVRRSGRGEGPDLVGSHQPRTPPGS